jgi:hypothetical protein
MKKVILVSLSLLTSLAQFETINTSSISTAVITINDERLKLPDQERIAKIDEKIYQVKYTHISVGYSVPATYPAGQPHHSCTAIVYFSDTDLKIGEMSATWTPQGCFEDNPQMIAQQVLEQLRNNL